MSTIGENISQRRKELGWTQEELAKRMGYKSKSTINKIELGINDIPQSKIVQFALVLNTTPAHLMGWVDEQTDQQPFDAEPLTEGEQQLIDLFRRVPEEQQQLVLQMIRVALGGNQE